MEIPPNEIETTVSLFPPKPQPAELQEKRSNSIVRFLVSLVLFIGVYYFFISKNWQFLIWLIVIVLIHELGHYFAMKIFKYEDLSIFFIPFLGAAASGSKEQISQKEKAIVLLAGPVPGIIIGILLLLFREQLDYSITKVGYMFLLVNVFNLLPIYPLDGGQLLRTLFLGKKEIISNIFIILSVIAIAWFAITHKDWILLIVPYFLLMRLGQEGRTNKIRRQLDELNIDYNKGYSALTDEEYWRIRDEVGNSSPVWRRIISPGIYEVAEKETGIINYIKTILITPPLKDLPIAGIISIVIIWLAAFIIPVLLLRNLWFIYSAFLS